RQLGAGAGTAFSQVLEQPQTISDGGHGCCREADSVAHNFADERVRPGLIKLARGSGMLNHLRHLKVLRDSGVRSADQATTVPRSAQRSTVASTEICSR